ncbi:Putative sulfur deprivation response regulator [Durusdinium trenchii]|uniref:Sulfur deprivation response regulator n=1 Tax=Durusdinium trenchii TaxID=1381693 RepID=A0ABP0LGU8_9DINO
MRSVGAGAAGKGTVAPVRSGGSRGHRNVFIQLAELLHAFRLLQTQTLQSPTAANEQKRDKCSTLFPRWLIAVNLLFVLFCVLLEICLHPPCLRSNPDLKLKYPAQTAYATLITLVFGLTQLLNGVRSSFVFAGYLAVLAIFGIVGHNDIVQGFRRLGPWLPQLQFVIICGIHDSGILEFSLLRMLGGQHREEWTFPRARLYLATLCMGAFVGATTTITVGTPVIIQWAKSHSFQLRPLLLMMVVAATCGNSVFVTSSPSSIAIRDIICNSDTGCELKSQAFLALTNAAILGLYVVMIGEVLSRKDQQPRLPQAQRRTGFSDPELTSCRLEMPEVLSGADASESEVSDLASCLSLIS